MDMDYRESLLQAWMDLSVSVRGNRILQEMSFNEILICRILYRQREDQGNLLTATDLCERTRLLKSQINRILCGMEEKGYIERIRSSEDKRKVYVKLQEKHVGNYLKEHAYVLEILDEIGSRMGQERAGKLAELISEAVMIIDETQKEN